MVEVVGMTRRSAVAKVTAVGVLAVLIAAGAVGIYFYTAAPGTLPTLSTTTASTSGAPPPSGYQDSKGQPQGSWANYLGYVPTGYVLAPHYPNANVYPCPSGMDATQCANFKASCGNGVCDPNESCATCPLDCGVPGQLTCDPYTGRAGGPVSVCLLGGQA